MKKLIFKKKFQVLFWLVLVAAAISLPIVVFGIGEDDTGYRNYSGQALSVGVYNTTYKCGIMNNSGVDYFIPTRTLGEWNALYAHAPALSLSIACCRNDGNCDASLGETCDSCPHDCDYCGGGGSSICGDGICSGSETAANCPYDCTTGCCSGPGACNTYTIGVRCTKYPDVESCSWNPSAKRCYPFAYCGDGICNNGETSSSCSQDCYVGNHQCTAGSGKNCNNDPTDCGACYCGNGTCDSGETCSSCPSECGACASGCQGPSGCSNYSTQFVCNKYTSFGCYWVNASQS